MSSERAAHLDLIAATFTACHADGSLDLDAVERQAAALAGQRLRGVFVCGTTGEAASLSTEERMRVAARWCEVAAGDLEVIVHVGHTSLIDAQALATHARQVGASAIAAVGPFYFRPRTVAELVDCCARIAAAADLPFFYYHIPSLTGIRLSMTEFLSAARAAIPSLAGIKFTDEDLADFARCFDDAAGRYEILFGRDEILLAALSLGARSAVGSTYNFAAPLYHRMAEAFALGDVQAARSAQRVARRMIECGVAHGGLPAFKAMMAWFGVDCGPCRPPLATLDARRATQLRAELERFDFFSEVARAGEPANGSLP